MARTRTYRTEGDVKTQVKTLLKQHGWMYWMPPANGYGRTGIADINALRGGVFLAVETKFGKNTVTPMQRQFLQQVMAHDAFAFVVDEHRVEVFAAWLAAFDRAAMAVQSKQTILPDDGAGLLDAIRAMTTELHPPA